MWLYAWVAVLTIKYYIGRKCNFFRVFFFSYCYHKPHFKLASYVFSSPFQYTLDVSSAKKLILHCPTHKRSALKRPEKTHIVNLEERMNLFQTKFQLLSSSSNCHCVGRLNQVNARAFSTLLILLRSTIFYAFLFIGPAFIGKTPQFVLCYKECL